MDRIKPQAWELATLLVAAACLALVLIDYQNLAEISYRNQDAQRIKSETDELLFARGGNTNLIHTLPSGERPHS